MKSVFLRLNIHCGFACASVLVITLLGGCGLLGDNTATSAFVAPGKFEYYNCDQLEQTGRGLSAREKELTELTERAGQGPGGEFVGKVAYHTELMQTRGQLKQIVDVAGRKNCSSQSKWQSDRALW